MTDNTPSAGTAAPPSLLVPIRVDALVITNDLLDDGWSPAAGDLQSIVQDLGSPGPGPFFGATVPPVGSNKAIQPPKGDTGDAGVYVHWTVPAALRHAHGSASAEFPPLPDRWLLVRYCRKTSSQPPQLMCWLVESSVKSTAPDRVDNIFDSEYNVMAVGTSILLTDSSGNPVSPAPAPKPSDPEVTLTALGTATTGEPAFTATVAGHFDVFSFHDPLTDAQTKDLKVPSTTSLSYLVVGWTESATNDPLVQLPGLLAAAGTPAGGTTGSADSLEANPSALLDALGWRLLEPDSAPPSLAGGRTLCHGMTASIYYWDQPTGSNPPEAKYWGTQLGHPGSSPVPGSNEGPSKPTSVGLGETAAGAVTALVKDQAGGVLSPTETELLETHLVGKLTASGQTDPLHHAAMHRQQFRGLAAGVEWRVVPAELDPDDLTRGGAAGSGDGDGSADDSSASSEISPTILQALDALNEAQRNLDQASRSALILQQQLSGLWWWWLHANINGTTDQVEAANKIGHQIVEAQSAFASVDPATGPASSSAADAASAGNAALQHLATGRNSKLTQLVALLGNEKSAQPRAVWAPRPTFFSATDPVLAIQGLDPDASAEDDGDLICRLAGQTATTVTTPDGWTSATAALGIATDVYNSVVPKDLQAVVGDLLAEAGIFEQTLAALVAEPPATPRSDVASFVNWVGAMNAKLVAQNGSPTIGFNASPSPPGRSSPGAPQQIPASSIGRLWGKQPWTPRYLDWHIEWKPSAPEGDGFGPNWSHDGADYVAAKDFVLPPSGLAMSGRTHVSPVGGWITQAVDALEDLLSSISDESSAYTEAMDLKGYLQQLDATHVLLQPLGGFHERLTGRDPDAPRARYGAAANKLWRLGRHVKGFVKKHGSALRDVTAETLTSTAPALIQAQWDSSGTGLPNPPGLPPLASPRVAPPDIPSATASATSSSPPPSLLRSGAVTVERLWLVDDFGQWVDLVALGTSVTVGPRLDYSGAPPKTAALPPRILQPGQLDVALVSASDPNQLAGESDANNPVCGWLIYNHVDGGLVLYDQNGAIQGELELRQNGAPNWECLAPPGTEVTVDTLPDPTLRAFAQALQGQDGGLESLLALIDGALPLITPAGPRVAGGAALLAGRPLALVNARLSLQLFGDQALAAPWNGVDSTGTFALEPAPGVGTGDATLDALELPVALGSASYGQDGLIGAFPWQDWTQLEANDFQKIVPFAGHDASASSNGYIGSQGGVTASFKTPQTVTLLMDPRGTAQAAVGIFPARTFEVPRTHLTKPLRNLELSLRVDPVIDRGPRPGLPIPTGRPGIWWFRARDNNENAGQRAANPPRVRPGYDDQTPIAYGGHLVLYQPGTSQRPPTASVGDGMWLSGTATGAYTGIGSGELLAMPGSRVLEVTPSGPSSMAWTLRAYDAKDAANPLRGPVVGSGSLTVEAPAGGSPPTASSVQLLAMPDGSLLGWAEGTTAASPWWLWRYDPAQSTFDDPPTTGSWQTDLTGHELVAMPSGLVLDRDPGGAWKLLRYAPGDPEGLLSSAPLSSGSWTPSPGSQLLALGSGQVVDWSANDEGVDWQLWEFEIGGPTPDTTTPKLPRSHGTWSGPPENAHLARMPDDLVLAWSAPTTNVPCPWSLWERPFSEIDESPES